MTSYYQVNSYLDDTFISSSDVFQTKEDAVNFKEVLDNNNEFMNYVVECTILKDSVRRSLPIEYYSDEESEDEMVSHDNMTVEELENEARNIVKHTDPDMYNDWTIDENYDVILKIYNYGNNYFLKCPQDNPYYGMHKYEEGIWDEENEGWMFDKNCDKNKLGKLGIFIDQELEVKKNYNLRTRRVSFK